MNNKFCSFYLGDLYVGVDILDVREISLNTNFTPIPHAPEEVIGMVNLRGVIHMILDLRTLFHQSPSEITPDSRLIIFKTSITSPMGILVDSVGDVIEYDKIEERRTKDKNVNSSGRKPSSSITKGVCKLPNELMVVLDTLKLSEYRSKAS